MIMKLYSGSKNLSILRLLGLSYVGCSVGFGIVISGMEMVKSKEEYIKLGVGHFMFCTVTNTMICSTLMPFFVPIVFVGTVGNHFLR